MSRTALITGAAGGIGLATARRLAQEGYRVIVHDLAPGVEAVARELEGDFLLADLSDPEATPALARAALRLHGKVDVLVNNAGFQHLQPVDEFPEEIWERMLRVMLTAPFQLIKYLLPAMKQQRWGRVINVASIHGLVASPFKSAYITAKHGLVGLTKAVALEAGAYGVTVNAVCPAYVRTPLVERQVADQARARGLQEDEVIEKVMLAPAAIKRLIEPGEVAGLIAYLASEQASAITGSTQLIDLGWLAE